MPPTMYARGLHSPWGGGGRVWGGGIVPPCHVSVESRGRENVGVMVRLYVGASVTIS